MLYITKRTLNAFPLTMDGNSEICFTPCLQAEVGHFFQWEISCILTAKLPWVCERYSQGLRPPYAISGLSALIRRLPQYFFISKRIVFIRQSWRPLENWFSDSINLSPTSTHISSAEIAYSVILYEFKVPLKSLKNVTHSQCSITDLWL